MSTDASQTGWGAVWEGRTVRGHWEHQWDKEHINVLELRAIHLGLRALLPFIQGKHVLVRTDNRSAVYYVNHQGGTGLPVRADLLSQVWGRIWHPRPAVLQLWAWPLLSPCLKG